MHTLSIFHSAIKYLVHFMFILTMDMPFRILFLALIILSQSKSSCSSKPFSLTKSSYLSVEKQDDYLISQNRLFTAGFYSVGHNAYSFAVWFTEPLSDGSLTAVWMANRDTPVNGKYSKLSLSKSGNLVLKDADLIVWASGTTNLTDSLELKLNDTGNLFLQNSNGGILWQSFDSPTDTILPNQIFNKFTELVSSTSLTNYSSGFFKLYYDNDNVLRLLYNGPSITSVYWPDPALRAWDAGRSTYMTERTVKFNSTGYFRSTDALSFDSSDYGEGPMRRLTLDTDGNVRLYSLDQSQRTWQISWQAISQPCTIHGICGVNSTCSHDPKLGRKCSCLPRHTMINENDWSYGCQPEFNTTLCGNNEDVFVHLRNVQFFGFDAFFFANYTVDGCRKKCLSTCNCKGYQYEFDVINGYYNCYVKFRLFSGWSTGNFNTSFYLKLPKVNPSANPSEASSLKCLANRRIELQRSYQKKQESFSLKFMLRFTCVVGGLEVVFVMIFFYKTQISSPGKRIQGYIQAATGFKRFSYAELKSASRNFTNEIGRGGGGVVYKGKLSDGQVVAIKRLKEASVYQGEAEFLAEMSTIGRVNHMNLIGILGYCAEGRHRLMVYEYMEHGSLAENLHLGTLDWEKRCEIAVGTARGLAYLHEECLEWVLHCDVKPQNILLDSKYKPKVADFGLSKLLERGSGTGNSFSRARGTRGYMAPEWVSNLPITSKVDVYSYGVVVLEMITGRKPITGGDGDGGMDQRKLVSWVKEKLYGGDGGMEEILDPRMKGKCDMGSLENLAKIALRCVDEDKDSRPSMSQVVNMLLHPEKDQYFVLSTEIF